MYDFFTVQCFKDGHVLAFSRSYNTNGRDSECLDYFESVQSLSFFAGKILISLKKILKRPKQKPDKKKCKKHHQNHRECDFLNIFIK